MSRGQHFATERERELYTALHYLLAVVDRMDRRPSAGGGVLPADKALATGAARAALANADTETEKQP